MEIAKRLQSIHEYYFSQKLREIDELNMQGRQVINLGIGSPDLPPHPDVITILQKEALRSDVHGYQNYKGSPVLRQAFTGWYRKWYGVILDPDTEVLPLIGSKEGIMHICMTYLNEGDAALVPDPGYPTYRNSVQIAGGICVEYELNERNNYHPDFAALEQTDLSRVKLMFVNYPHMPTGQAGNPGLFKQIVDFGRKHNILIVHDNPYSFILNDNPLSILSTYRAMDTVIELNSLSKSHNLAGWRIGVLCGAEERVNEVLRFKSNMDSGMFLPIQLAAAKALELEKEWYHSVNTVYQERRHKAFELLGILNCSYSAHQAGMFIWAKIDPSYSDGYAMSDDILYQHSVFITPGGIFGNAGKQYIRVSLCKTPDIFDEAIERIKGNSDQRSSLKNHINKQH